MIEKPRYTLRISRELLDKVAYIASYEGRSKNNTIERILLRYIADFEKHHGPIPLSENK